MCHNSVLESEQIDKCIENGMPHKIVKAVKYTMRRRVAEAAVVTTNKTPQNITDLERTRKGQTSTTGPFQMKCPFAHGLIKIPPTPVVADSNSNELQFTNSYGSLLQRYSSGSIHNSTSDNKSGDDDDVATGITNLSGHIEQVPPTHEDDDIVYNDDILAKSTQYTRKLTFHMQHTIGRLQKSKIYTLLTRTTQPAHVLAICIPSFVLLTIWPELIYGAASKQPKQLIETTDDHSSSSSTRTLALIAYLCAFSTHFGSQIWMTFVSGLSLYFSLPRHMFGQCQQILFPKYFAMNGVLSITMIILFVKFFLNSWSMPQCIQLGALSLTGAIEVIVRLYLAPPLLYLMHEKYKIEGTIGSGKEVGSLVQGDLIQCPHYQRIHKAFRRIHMTVAIGNLITMIASCLHLYYIASKIQISI